MSDITEFPRGNCALGGVNAVLSAINRVVPIYHAGPGCCMQNAAGEAGQAGGRTPFFTSGVSTPCSNMLEKEVVFGGVDKLRDTIDGTIEIYDADAFFVITGCTAGIIGDDVVNVAREYRKKGIPVYPIEAPGFMGESYLGYEIAFQALLNSIVKPAEKQKSHINLFGFMPYHDPFWEGNFEEITRILEKLGLSVNTFFTRHQGIEAIRNSSAASLNIIISPWLLNGAEKEYSERFGVPSLRWPGLPVGATDTSNFLRAVGKSLQIESALVERVIVEEEDYVYSYLETAIGSLSWKRFAVVGDANTVVGITRFLANDYSFTPIVSIVTDPIFRQSDKDLITQQLANLEYARPPKVVFETDQWKIKNELDAHDEVTLLIGSSNDRETGMEKDIQCTAISYPVTDRLIFNRTYAGYRGCLTLVEDLYDNL